MSTQTQTQQTSYYQPQIVTEHNLHDAIGDAYRAYGLDAPTRASEVKRLLNADTNIVPATVARLAAAALEPHSDLEAWHTDALEQIREAQARQDLAQAFGRDFQRHVFATAPKYQALAYDDLASHVAKTIKTLEQAAKALPTGAAALDPETVIATDAGKHLGSARAALATLATASRIHLPLMDRDVPQRLRQLAPIVHFPNAAIEQTQRHLGYDTITLNEDELGGTREIRNIATHLHDHGTDATIIAIARGDFPGTRLAYADKAALSTRRANLVNAYARHTTAAA